MSGVSFHGSNYGTFNQAQVKNTQDTQATLKTHDANTAIKDLEGAVHAAEAKHEDAIVIQDGHGKVFTMDVHQAEHLLENMKMQAASGDLDLHHIEISDHKNLDEMITSSLEGILGDMAGKPISAEHIAHKLHVSLDVAAHLEPVLKSLGTPAKVTSFLHKLHHFMESPVMKGVGIAMNVYDMAFCATEMNHYMSEGDFKNGGAYAARMALNLGAIMSTMMIGSPAAPAAGAAALGFNVAVEGMKFAQGDGGTVQMVYDGVMSGAAAVGKAYDHMTSDAVLTFHDDGGIMEYDATIQQVSNVDFASFKDAQKFMDDMAKLPHNPIEGNDYAILKGKDGMFKIASLTTSLYELDNEDASSAKKGKSVTIGDQTYTAVGFRTADDKGAKTFVFK